MAEYKFADRNGEIVSENYVQVPNSSPEKILESLKIALALFPYDYSIEIIEDMRDVFHITSSVLGDIYICGKAVTPGGRSGLNDEQRIQPKAKYLNYVFDKQIDGSIGIFLGIYVHDGQTIFCTWKTTMSTAAPETPISKQIKITGIATAIKEGFAQCDKGQGEYACAFKPEFLYFYLRNYKWLHTSCIMEVVSDSNSTIKDSQNGLESLRISCGENILLYGVPGSGKSWTIAHEYCKKNTKVERLVFHPDYTYAEFVGQILPDVQDGAVTYKFMPGPFTSILRDAYQNPNDEYILIIEEINRGNAPAIFGEIFQLLDRMTESKTVNEVTYQAGTSEYEITNRYMAIEIYGDEKHKIRIPSNLSIIGTMNTSDQNVFTLDTAFQRRWNMRLIENSFKTVRSTLADAEILDTGVTWKHFCETVNNLILDNKNKLASAEDKRLGVYFVHENDLKYDNAFAYLKEKISDEYDRLLVAESNSTITDEEKNILEQMREMLKHNRKFAEKVIKYLWDDAFKFNVYDLFDIHFKSLETVIDKFVFLSEKKRFEIFQQNVRDKLFGK